MSVRLQCVCVPLVQPQALPGGQRLSRVLQHPQLVEEHHVEEHQQDQAAGDATSSKLGGLFSTSTLRLALFANQ